MRTYGLLGAAAFQLVGAVVGMALVGRWLGNWLGIPLIATAVGVLLGAMGGFWNLWLILKWRDKMDRERL